MICRIALLTLALALTACAASSPKPQPIPAVATQRQCPSFPKAPSDLLKPPTIVDFLSTNG